MSMSIKEIAMNTPSVTGKGRAHALPHKPHKSPSEEDDEDEEGIELPVNPDEGAPLVPDEEGDVTVPA